MASACIYTDISSHPFGVTVARFPGRNSTVVMADSTIAGPAIAWPGAISSNSNTGTVVHSRSHTRRSPRGAASACAARTGSDGTPGSTPINAARAFTARVSEQEEIDDRW